MRDLEHITARAQTPDQLLPYIAAVSGMKSQPCSNCVLHRYDNMAVLVAYSPDNPHDVQSMESAVEEALALPGIRSLTVLGPAFPSQAPAEAQRKEDLYWGLDLEKLNKSSKLRNMLKRSARELELEKGGGKNCWTPEHDNLVDEFCSLKKGRLGEDAVFLFHQMGKYMAGAHQAMLFSCRDKRGILNACAVADFSALGFAFYMFAFRISNAVPGSADFLLNAIIGEAQARGHEKLNLGLGINGGVEFFKKKWGAMPLFPYRETSWQIKRKGWLSRLFHVKLFRKSIRDAMGSYPGLSGK